MEFLVPAVGTAGTEYRVGRSEMRDRQSVFIAQQRDGLFHHSMQR